MQNKEREYVDRIRHESDLIVSKDFVDYMLMLSDVVRYAKDAGIPVGPARGSAAASLVCYLLRITEVDPLQFPMMVFERFIDVTRVDLPDVDLDFADDRRGEIRDYLVRRYGADQVGNVANFVRYLGKTSVNDVARVYQLPFNDTDTLKNHLIERSDGDARFSHTLEDTIDLFPAARAAFDRHPELSHALKLEGNMRGMNVHAAGFVVSSEPIAETCALISKTVAGEPRTVLPYDKKDIEYLGMLKADFLGLTTLGAIGHTLDLIGMPLAELYRVPLDEPDTLEAFRRGNVHGIFQFEGQTTRGINAQVQPEHINHLADINALARPGPLHSGTAEQYIAVRHGRVEAKSWGAAVDAITGWTYGQIVYQEQILRILSEVGGLPPERVAAIRKIISKKLGEAQFNELFAEFAAGAAELHGYDEAHAKSIWSRMTTASAYAFNVAHAVSYSILAFYQMWLKVHHPTEFFAGSLRKISNTKENREWKIPRMLRDAQKHGITIYPPSLARLAENWDVRPDEPGCLQAGLLQIPNIGDKQARTIAEVVRTDPQRFQTWTDLEVIKGIGPKKVDAIRSFCLDPDPFNLEVTGRVLTEVRTEIRRRAGQFRYIPRPTHLSHEIPSDEDTDVVWIGIVKDKKYRDELEDERARSGKDVKEILAEMRDPDLLTSCVLRCYDDGEEELTVKVNRWRYPEFKDRLARIVEGQDVVVVQGRVRAGLSRRIHCKNLYVISIADDEDDEGTS